MRIGAFSSTKLQSTHLFSLTQNLFESYPSLQWKISGIFSFFPRMYPLEAIISKKNSDFYIPYYFQVIHLTFNIIVIKTKTKQNPQIFGQRQKKIHF